MTKQPVYNFSQMNFSRVAVIGCPGSGKTTFANALGGILSREVVHLDKILWNPNWEMLPYESRAKIHGELISRENWLIDGMWRSHLPERYSRATLVIFLDYKRRICLSRALKRRVKYSGKQRDDIADGCLEKLDSYFLKYIWNFRRDVRPQILDLAKTHADTAQTLTLSSPKQTEVFLLQLKSYMNGEEQ